MMTTFGQPTVENENDFAAELPFRAEHVRFANVISCKQEKQELIQHSSNQTKWHYNK